MPDCHAGAGCVIGTTMKVTDKVCPNLVGVDIGCGVDLVYGNMIPREVITTPSDFLKKSCRRVVIENGIKSLGKYAFREQPIEEIVLSDSVTKIGEDEFRDCKSLKGIVIPDGVTKIGDQAFRGCTSLEKVIFGGTKEQWEEIEIDIENDKLLESEVEFAV